MKANVIWSRVWLGEQACGSALETEQTWGTGRDGEILLYQGSFLGASSQSAWNRSRELAEQNNVRHEHLVQQYPESSSLASQGSQKEQL